MTDLLDRFVAAILPAEPEAASLRSLALPLVCAAGQSAALPPQAHYVWIACGNAKLVAHGASGRQQVTEFHFAGDLVQVPALAAYGFTLDAISACEMLAFPAAQLHHAARSNPVLAFALLERMSAAITRSREVVVTLGHKRAVERVAGFLLNVRNRMGANGGALSLPMSRRDIGDNLAITVESISREVGRLRKDRVIDTPARSRVCILDAERLAGAADIFAGAA